MYWKVTATALDASTSRREDDGMNRFVLHRHSDANGEHLDLRLECADALRGWRIDGAALEGEVWATEKQAHSKRWLDETGSSACIDSGRYAFEHESIDEVVLRLEGRRGAVRIRANRVPDLPVHVVRGVVDAMTDAGAPLTEAAALIADGVLARNRAIVRLCGLGRELDGSAFDETVWRKTLRGLGLDEIHAQLRAFEVRFDLKYPAAPVSRPERLPEIGADRAAQAMEILRG